MKHMKRMTMTQKNGRVLLEVFSVQLEQNSPGIPGYSYCSLFTNTGTRLQGQLKCDVIK